MELEQLEQLKLYDRVICNGHRGRVARTLIKDNPYRVLVEYDEDIDDGWLHSDNTKANFVEEFVRTPNRRYWNATSDEVEREQHMLEIPFPTTKIYSIWN